MLVAIISAIATIDDHSLSRWLMGVLVVGCTVLAGVLCAESRRQRQAPTARTRYTTVGGLTVALAALTLVALVNSL